MRNERSSEEIVDAARIELRQAIMTAFCGILQGTRLPALVVMTLVAEAVGSIYGEVADAHGRDGICPCGWHPSEAADILALQSALAATAERVPSVDLRFVQAAGRA